MYEAVGVGSDDGVKGEMMSFVYGLLNRLKLLLVVRLLKNDKKKTVKCQC